jgi:hypothetical protein
MRVAAGLAQRLSVLRRRALNSDCDAHMIYFLTGIRRTLRSLMSISRGISDKGIGALST